MLGSLINHNQHLCIQKLKFGLDDTKLLIHQSNFQLLEFLCELYISFDHSLLRIKAFLIELSRLSLRKQLRRLGLNKLFVVAASFCKYTHFSNTFSTA